jgi:FSR family fosmidomycin resistance protein-like MFS transporter
LLAFPGPGAFFLGALVGFVADFSLPSTLTLAQGLMPGRVGVTSGLILGIGFVTAGIGVSITAALADRIGLTEALAFLPLLLILALVLTFFLPHDQRLDGKGPDKRSANPRTFFAPLLGPLGGSRRAN